MNVLSRDAEEVLRVLRAARPDPGMKRKVLRAEEITSASRIWLHPGERVLLAIEELLFARRIATFVMPGTYTPAEYVRARGFAEVPESLFDEQVEQEA